MAIKKRQVIECKYQFSAAELDQIADDHARAALEVERLEGEKKSSMKHYADVIEAARIKARNFAMLRTARYEMRDVDCDVIFSSPRAGLKTFVRRDTGELVGEPEQMTPAENQLEIPLTEPGGDPS